MESKNNLTTDELARLRSMFKQADFASTLREVHYQTFPKADTTTETERNPGLDLGEVRLTNVREVK